MTRFQKLAIVTTLANVFQVTLGALVRATGSGLACPDWPRCFGKWIPPFRKDTLTEYAHRLSGTVLGGLVLALAVTAWLKHRNRRSIFIPCLIALVVVGVEGWIGREVVLGDLPRNLVALHFFLSITLLGLLTFATVTSFQGRQKPDSALGKHGAIAAASTFLLAMVGAFVSQYGAALAFPDWPLMNGSIAPSGGGTGTLHYTHRLAALIVGAILIALAIRTSKTEPRDKTMVALAHSLSAVWLAQVVIGAINVFTRSAPWAIVAHVLFAALLWALAVWFTVCAFRRSGTESEPIPVADSSPEMQAAVLEKVKAYFLLTKPRIIELLLITTVPAMMLAAKGWTSPWLILATLIGGTLAAGSANSINCYLDRDIDEKMERTSTRPLPRHQIPPTNALIFGIILGIIGFAWLIATVNVEAAALAVGAILFYVFIYTMAMKRSTPSNIVIGGAAGAVPVLVGWAAVTGGLSRSAWVLFAIIFYWTPPHFWALALRYTDQYRAAGVPMLPVVRGVEETTRQILLYTVVLFAVSLLLFSVAGLGVFYLTLAVVMGGAFIWYGSHLKTQPDEKRAMGLFHFSITYLVLLFAGIAVDQLINDPLLPGLYAPVLGIAAALFVVFEIAILASVFGYDRAAGGRKATLRGRPVAELLWTVIPLLVMAGLFLLSWQAQGIAAP